MVSHSNYFNFLHIIATTTKTLMHAIRIFDRIRPFGHACSQYFILLMIRGIISLNEGRQGRSRKVVFRKFSKKSLLGFEGFEYNIIPTTSNIGVLTGYNFFPGKNPHFAQILHQFCPTIGTIVPSCHHDWHGRHSSGFLFHPISAAIIAGGKYRGRVA